MHVLQVVEHVIALKTSFLQKFTYSMHYCALNQNMGCLRVHSNILTGLSLAIYLARLERAGIRRSDFGDDRAS